MWKHVQYSVLISPQQTIPSQIIYIYNIYIIIAVLVTVAKELVQGVENLKIRGRTETIHTTALSRLLEYCGESWRLEETLSLKVQWETIGNAGVEIRK